MKNKTRVAKLLSSIKKIRSGETSATQLYEIPKNGTYTSSEPPFSPHSDESPDRWTTHPMPQEWSELPPPTSWDYSQPQEDLYQDIFQKSRSPTPVEEHLDNHRIETMFANIHPYQKKNTLTQLDFDALKSLDEALLSEEPQQTHHEHLLPPTTPTPREDSIHDLSPSPQLEASSPPTSSCATHVMSSSFHQTLPPHGHPQPPPSEILRATATYKDMESNDSHTVANKEFTPENNLIEDTTTRDQTSCFPTDFSTHKVVNPPLHNSEAPEATLSYPIDPSVVEWMKERLTQEALVFYLLDIVEESNRLLLYGKILNRDQKTVSSACILIKHVERNIFVHPKESLLSPDCLDMEQVSKLADRIHEELGSLRKQLGITRWMFKPVKRQFFIPHPLIPPRDSTWFVKFVYSSLYGPFPPGVTGESFDAVFGSATSLTELFLLKRHIYGPSWLVIHGATPIHEVDPTGSRAKEFVLHGTRHIRLLSQTNENITLPCPPLNVLAVSLQSSFIQKSSPSTPHHIVALVAVCGTIDQLDSSEECNMSKAVSFHGSALPPNMQMWPADWKRLADDHHLSLMDHDKQLVSSFLSFVQAYDPDVLVAHGLVGSIAPLIAQRLLETSAATDWHQMSRLRRPWSQFVRAMSTPPGTSRDLFLTRFLTLGRLCCDTELQAREILRGQATFDLGTITKFFDPSIDLPSLSLPSNVPTTSHSKTSFFQLFSNCKVLAQATLDIMSRLQILTLTKELTCIAGNLWNRSLLNYRAERNELLLLHQFHKEKLILPEISRGAFPSQASSTLPSDPPETLDDTSQKNKTSYIGGLVFEPRVGFYDRFVLLLDFKSLYPSIIQEYNICFTTLTSPPPSHLEHPLNCDTTKRGILPAILQNLVERRRNVKNAMKSAPPLRKKILDLKQQALKLTANSIYGCLGFRHSRFYAKHLAAYITEKGRELLLKTRHQVEDVLHLNVLYGDTDSLMVDTKIQDDNLPSSYRQAQQTAAKIQSLVNKSGSCLELEFECIMTRLLLLKKKKYAALKVIDYEKKLFQRELKGLDIVRRDWCRLSKSLGQRVLDILFDSQNTLDMVVEKVHDLLRHCTTELHSNRVPLELFLITKGLNKLPQHYPDAQALPHVQVAKRLMEQGDPLHIGSEIEYIICEDSTSSDRHLASRAYTLQEVQSQNLKVDVAWYKTTQILPVISRLCEHLQGTDTHRLGECLDIKIHSSTYSTLPSPSPQIMSNHQQLIKSSKLHKEDSLLSQLERLTLYPTDFSLLNDQKLPCLFCRQPNNVLHLLPNFQCPPCHRDYPLTSVLHWFSRFIHSMFWKLGRFERICTEAETPLVTTRAFMSGALFCPQAYCSHSKNEPTLVPVIQSSDVYKVSYYIVLLLKEKWKTQPEAKKLIQHSCTHFNILSRHNFCLQSFVPLLIPKTKPSMES